ncbi:hypothetical protein [Vacuolonema iberomarrocanum]|nr:hypothetical protein [filamentous cyanobacterium LEGE 07170]
MAEGRGDRKSKQRRYGIRLTQSSLQCSQMTRVSVGLMRSPIGSAATG